MILSKKNITVVYIDQKGLFHYGNGQSFGLRYEFLDAVSNMDVVNEEKIIKGIQNFVQTNKIIPSPLVFLLAKELLFEKKIQKSQNTQDALLTDPNEQADIFLESIPFEHVLSKKIKNQNDLYVVGANNDLVQAVVHAFEQLKFTNEAIFPITCLGEDIPSGGITKEYIEKIFQKYDSLKPCDLIQRHEQGVMHITPSSKEELKKPKPRLLLLAGVFGILILLMIVMFFANKDALFPPKPIPKLPANKTQVTFVTPTQAVSTSSATVALQDVSIIITSPRISTKSAESIRAQLRTAGFSKISIEPSANATGQKNTVIFPDTFPAVTQLLIISELEKIIPGFSVVKIKEEKNTVQIILAN